MSTLRLTVSASADRSLGRVFEGFLETSARARAKVSADMQATATAMAKSGKTGADALDKEFAKATKSAEKAYQQIQAASAKAAAREEADASKAAQARVRADLKAFDEKVRASAKATAQFERDLDREVKAAERAAEQKAKAEARGEGAGRQRSWAAVGSGAMRNLGGVMRAGVGVAAGVARGAGVDFDLGGLVGRSVSNRSIASDIANSGYIEGEQGAAGQRQSSSGILSDAKAAAKAAAVSTTDALEGLQRFVAKSSDLETGRAILADMAKLSKATGSNMVDVVEAAGDVDKKLGDVPNKAEAIRHVMMIAARQGKLGAVEMRDFAATLSVMVGPANQFAEGTEKAMSHLGTVFQIVNKFGGVKGPQQAATSVSSFAADLTSKGGLKALTGASINPFANAEKTKLRAVDEIIIEALQKTGGDLSKIGSLFSNKRTAAVVKSFNQIYSDGEATQKGSGAEAVRGTFSTFGAAMGQGDLDKSLASKLEDPAAKIQLFNNKLEEVGERVAARLIPALDRLAPEAGEIADSFGKLVAWAAENPGEMIAAAIVASIGKAALGEAVGAALASFIKKTAGSYNSGAGLGGGIGAMGNIGAGLTIAAAAVTVTTLGIALIDDLSKRASRGETSSFDKDAANYNALSGAQHDIKHGGATAEDIEALKKAKADLDVRIANAKDPTGAINSAINPWAPSVQDAGQERADADRMGQLQADREALKATLAEAMAHQVEAIKAIKINVNVSGGGKGVNNAARTGPGEDDDQ